MNSDLKEVEKIIKVLEEIKDLKAYKDNNTKEYEDNLYIIEEFSKFIARKSETFKEPELEDLNKLLEELEEKHSDLKDFVDKVKKEIQICLFSKELVDITKKMMAEPDLEAYSQRYGEEYDKQIGRIIDCYNYIKENAKEDSLEMYLCTKNLRELKSTHKELEKMVDELLYSNKNKKVDLEELKKQREEKKENQLKCDKLEANIKALSLEIVEYYKRPGFDKNKYKQFADKLQKYDKELYELKQTMSEEQYNRILEEYYRAQGNLEALNAEMMKQLNAQIEEEKRGNIKL